MKISKHVQIFKKTLNISERPTKWRSGVDDHAEQAQSLPPGPKPSKNEN